MGSPREIVGRLVTDPSMELSGGRPYDARQSNG